MILKRRMLGSLLAAGLVVSLLGCATTRGIEQAAYPGHDVAGDDARYLAHYFGIQGFQPTVTWAAFNDAIVKTGASVTEDVEPAASVIVQAAMKAIVQAASMTELALSYPAEKVAAALASRSVTGIDAAYAPYVACALDTMLVPAGTDFSAKLDGKTAAALLMNAVDAAGKGRRQLGFSDDQDIYASLQSEWDSFTLFDEKELTALGVDLVKTKVSTGYNLKYAGYDARFIPELTLQYGHSEIDHATQLLGLLKSEGLVARVQLEPKISVYEYLLEWGPIGKPTPTYAIIEAGEDFYLVNAIEYDLQLEFMNPEDKLAFNAVIESYAKKNKGNEKAIGLIRNSWWQPLYSSRTQMPAGTFMKIHDVVATNGMFSVHPFALEENLGTVKEAIARFNPALTVAPVPLWCNAAFYRYLTGTDSQ